MPTWMLGQQIPASPLQAMTSLCTLPWHGALVLTGSFCFPWTRGWDGRPPAPEGRPLAGAGAWLVMTLFSYGRGSWSLPTLESAPRAPIWEEAAAGYVTGCGLRKNVAGPGGIGGREQHLPPSSPQQKLQEWGPGSWSHTARPPILPNDVAPVRESESSPQSCPPTNGMNPFPVPGSGFFFWKGEGGCLGSSLGVLSAVGVLSLTPQRVRFRFLGLTLT